MVDARRRRTEGGRRRTEDGWGRTDDRISELEIRDLDPWTALPSTRVARSGQALRGHKSILHSRIATKDEFYRLM